MEAVENDGDAKLAQQLRDKYADVKAQTGPVIKLRHKVTAHTDRPTRRGAVSVPTVQIEEFNQAAKSIGEFLNVFDHAVNGSQAIFPLSSMDGEGEVLLRRLREAVAYREEVPDWHLLGNPERERIRALLKNAPNANDVVAQTANGVRVDFSGMSSAQSPGLGSQSSMAHPGPA